MRGPGDVLYNFHWIVPGEAARAAQAYAGFLGPFLARHRIKSLINLRGPNPKHDWWHYERRASAERGVTHIDLVLDSRHLPKREMLVALFDAFDAAPKPFLVKCSGGQDRTSFAAALYIIHEKGWDAYTLAENQFARWPYLHMPHQRQRWLKLFLFFARTDAQGRSLRDWVTQSYDPARFKSWLEAHGEAESFHGLYDPALGL